MASYYAAGGRYCRRRRCRVLFRERARRIRPVDDVDGLEPCDRHLDEGGESDATEWADRPAAAMEAGVCPWCESDDDRYEGENVGQHASSAHPEEWTEYREGDE